MSILPIIPLVKAYNADKRSIFATTEKYELSEADTQKVFKIYQAVHAIRLPYDVSLQICPYSGQLYLKCTERVKLPQVISVRATRTPVNSRLGSNSKGKA